MTDCRYSLHCIVPPYIIDRLAKSDDPKVRNGTLDAIRNASAVRAVRSILARMPGWAAIPSPSGKKYRLVYDARNSGCNDLPGTLVRSEGDPRTADPAANEAMITQARPTSSTRSCSRETHSMTTAWH